MNGPSPSSPPPTARVWAALSARQPLLAPAPDEIGWQWRELAQPWTEDRGGLMPDGGWAGITWTPDALHFHLVLFGADQSNLATRLNERTWELGNVAEVFLQLEGSGDYLEIHLTPENQRLQLRWTPDGLARVRQRTAKLEDYLVSEPNWVLSKTRRDHEYWSGVITVPAAAVGPSELKSGQLLRAAICRYHYRGAGEPLLSSTALLPSPSFHQPAHWSVVQLVNANEFPAKPPLSANGASATRPALRPDYTPAQVAAWLQSYAEQAQLARKGGFDVIFLGDSITAGWRTHGLPVWEEFFSPLRAACFGISGDRTQQLLWRIWHGAFDGLAPKVAVLLIGTNNLDPGLGTQNLTPKNTGPEIVAGIVAVVESLRQHLPRTRVLLLGLLPRGPADDPKRREIMAINDRLRSFAEANPHVMFIDAGPGLLQPDGNIAVAHMPDRLHLSASGYRLLAAEIIGPLNSLLKTPRRG